MGPEINTSYLTPRRELLLTKVEKNAERTVGFALSTIILSGFVIQTQRMGMNDVDNLSKSIYTGAQVLATSSYAYAISQYFSAIANRFKASKTSMESVDSLTSNSDVPTYSSIEEIVDNLPALERRVSELARQNENHMSYSYVSVDGKVSEFLLNGQKMELISSVSNNEGSLSYIDPKYAEDNVIYLPNTGAVTLFNTVREIDYHQVKVTEFTTKTDNSNRKIIHPIGYKSRSDLYTQLESTYSAVFERDWSDPVADFARLSESSDSDNLADQKPNIVSHTLLFRTIDNLVKREGVPEAVQAEIFSTFKELMRSVPISELILLAPHIMTRHILSLEEQKSINTRITPIIEKMNEDLEDYRIRSRKTEPNLFYGKYAMMVRKKTPDARRATNFYNKLVPQINSVKEMQALLNIARSN